MDSFLESAQKLEVEGLLSNNEDNLNEEKTFNQDESMPDQTKDDFHFQSAEENKIAKIDKTVSHIRRQHSRTPLNDVKFNVESLTPEEIEKKTADLYQKKDGVFSCLACNYTWSGRNGTWTMKRHIEVHFDGLSYTCSLCNKEFRSKISLILIYKATCV